MLLTEENTLFDSLDNKLIDYPDLKQMLMELLLQGNVIEYVPGNLGIRMAAMFGFVTIENYIVNVSRSSTPTFFFLLKLKLTRYPCFAW